MPNVSPTDPGQFLWGNAIQPYVKGADVLLCPAAKTDEARYGQYNFANVSYTYNGLLHLYPNAGVGSPASLPLFWEGLGRFGYVGTSSPDMSVGCGMSETCSYQTTAPGCHSASPGAISLLSRPIDTAWVHSHGANFLFADTHAKFRPLGPAGSALWPRRNVTETDREMQPWAAYGRSGIAWDANMDANGCHPNLFRPERLAKE